mgnify:CR=1 FL=1
MICPAAVPEEVENFTLSYAWGASTIGPTVTLLSSLTLSFYTGLPSGLVHVPGGGLDLSASAKSAAASL